MKKSAFVPIQSVNLAHYFNNGVISPTAYILNRNEDIQNKFSSYILFSSKPFTNLTDCALEVALNEPDEKLEQISQDFFVLNKPLPIARVKRIIFKDEAQKKSTVFNITNGAAFLPQKLIEVIQPQIILSTGQLTDLEIPISNNDWRQELEYYNRFLGGFALMSKAGNQDQNYSTNYFPALSNFNVAIRESLIHQHISVTRDYAWVFKENGNYTNLRTLIFSTITDNDLQEMAEKENLELVIQNGLYVMTDIPQNKNLYLAVILASYGAKRRKSIDTFISDLISNKFAIERKEGIALTFGINKGYNSFRNQYKTRNFKFDVKFKLDSLVDYYTIESIYQYVFNNKADNARFSYLDNWCPKFNLKEDNEYESYKILDKIITVRKKVKAIDNFEKIYRETLKERTSIYQKIINQLKKWWSPPFFSFDNEKGKTVFANAIEIELKHFAKSLYSQAIEEQKQLYEVKIAHLNKQISSQQLEIHALLKTEQSYKETSKTIADDPKENYPSESQQLVISQASQELHPKEQRQQVLSSLNLKKLKQIARELNIKNYSKYTNKNKKNLIIEIIKAEYPTDL